MTFATSRDEALSLLMSFIDNELSNYSMKRNFDYGPDNKSNVSCLSPTSLRLITEYEVAKTVLAKFPYQKLKNISKKYFGEFIGRVG